MKRTIKQAFTIILISLLPSLKTAAQIQIIPLPNSITESGEQLKIEKSVAIKEKNCAHELNYLTNELQTRYNLSIGKSNKQTTTIKLNNKETNSSDESYILVVNKKEITIEAQSQKGIFYGIQTLLQIINNSRDGNTICINTLRVEDSPRFPFRSFMLDEARNFKGEAEVIRLLDVMAELKFNTFHWHLTDDQGWRVEIKQYPELTSIGSKRKDTQIGGWNSLQRAGEPHEGFYTQEEIKRILKYAQERHIKIIPEIEMPGHASAAIAAYPWLGSKAEQIEVATTFGKMYPVFNVIKPEVVTFLQNVVTEVIELFETDVIHIGGDEVRFNQWEENQAIVDHKEKMGYSSFMDIQIAFSNNMSHFIEEKGCRMMGWNEILGKNLHEDDGIAFAEASEAVAKNVIVQFWKGELKEMADAAKKGYSLVNSYHAKTYLDYGYAQTPLSSAYDFNPIPDGLDEEYHNKIIGLGCQMWGEFTYTVEQMNYLIYPRIAAYAEVGWTMSENKDFDQFKIRLTPLIEGWRAKGIGKMGE